MKLRPSMMNVRRVLPLWLAMAVAFGAFVVTVTVTSGSARASAEDCKSYAYACTPGYTGTNASSTWAWKHYGGSYAQNANGTHNCTLYAAYMLAKNGMGDPGNWGNAVQWAGKIGGGNHTPAVGAIAWWGSEVAGGYGHVAYVDQVGGSQVHIMADNFIGTNSNGYTDSGWIAASTVDAFLHPHDVAPAGGGGGGGGSAGDPTGHLDRVAGSQGGFIEVSGWTEDPDAPQTSGIAHVYVNGPAGTGTLAGVVQADLARPDVGNAYPGGGVAHGFNSAVAGIAPGSHSVYVYAINIAGGGSNPLIGSGTVTVPAEVAGSPFGSFDSASGTSGGTVDMAGWTIDPDSPTTPTDVNVYVDGSAGEHAAGYDVGHADVSRPDVGSAYPGTGDAHGFATSISGLAPGPHTIWLYAINASGSGDNPLLGVKDVTVTGGDAPGAFVPVLPARLLDTRVGTGAAQSPLGAASTLPLAVAGRGGVPSSGVGAVVLNVTETGASAPGFLTVWADGTPRPTTSNVNFVAGQTVPNLVIAPVGGDGKVDIYNGSAGSAGSVQVVADTSGYFTASRN